MIESPCFSLCPSRASKLAPRGYLFLTCNDELAIVSSGYAKGEIFARKPLSAQYAYRRGSMNRIRAVRKPCKFTETDLRRAMRAAAKEHMPARIDLMPDGRISITPIVEAAAASLKGPTGPNEWDAVP
jgi:hypothetical protein